MIHRLSRENCIVKSGLKFVVNNEFFELGGKIGDGAAGLVRKATRLKDHAQRAIKFLAPDPKYIEVEVFDDVANRFRREGQRGAKLFHSHLLQVHSYCENANGTAFEAGKITNPFLVFRFIKVFTFIPWPDRISSTCTQPGQR